MTQILRLIIIALLAALFLYSKLLPHRLKLYPKYVRVFNFFDSVFKPVLQAVRQVFKPVVVGLNLSIDVSQVVLFVLLLALLQIL